MKVAAQAGATPGDIVRLKELIRVQVYEVLEEIASDDFQDKLRRTIDSKMAPGSL